MALRSLLGLRGGPSVPLRQRWVEAGEVGSGALRHGTGQSTHLASVRVKERPAFCTGCRPAGDHCRFLHTLIRLSDQLTTRSSRAPMASSRAAMAARHVGRLEKARLFPERVRLWPVSDGLGAGGD